MSLARHALVLLALAGTPAQAQQLAGTWDVTGADPGLGPYAGVAVLQPSAGGYRVLRLVELSQPLPDGRRLALAWEGQASLVGGGLRVEVDLRRQDFVRSLGPLSRGPQDRAPLRVSAQLTPTAGPLPAVPPVGTRLSGALAGGTETWVRSSAPPPPIPSLARRLEPAPRTVPRGLFFRVLAQYHALPELAPYVGRPEFQAGVHFQMVDDTGRAWTRAHPDRLLVVQKVPDAIARFEEDLRTSAFRWSLAEKARRWDDAMLRDHVEPSTGMVGGLAPGGARLVHGDSGLHQGVWVASQAFRYRATGEAQALANVELGTRALLAMVDAPGDPAEFARAVRGTLTGAPGWLPSAALPGVEFMPGGNNDMLHGVDYGFTMAEQVLPAGHPLLAEIGARAARLAEHNKDARSGKHAIVLRGLAARLGGGSRSRYRRKLWSVLDLLWLYTGEGLWMLQEVSGRSGAHLSTTTFARFQHLGGASPNALERLWRRAAVRGARFAWKANRVNRHGNLAAVAALAGDAAAGAVGKAVLEEIPYPTPLGAPAEIDWLIDPAFCASPYPYLPWKFDFLTNVRHRMQSLVGYPPWTIYATDNVWKEGPYFPFRGPLGSVAWSRQDYLHAYWVARAGGAIGPTD